MKKTIAFTALLVIMCVSSSAAWWSVPLGGSSTHHNLTVNAITGLSGIDYPDMIKYGGAISDWTSGSTDDARAHNPNSDTPGAVLNTLLDGGRPDIWLDRVLEKYEQFNFSNGDWSAYYYAALIMHLTEDQAVPAHAP